MHAHTWTWPPGCGGCGGDKEPRPRTQRSVVRRGGGTGHARVPRIQFATPRAILRATAPGWAWLLADPPGGQFYLLCPSHLSLCIFVFPCTLPHTRGRDLPDAGTRTADPFGAAASPPPLGYRYRTMPGGVGAWPTGKQLATRDCTSPLPGATSGPSLSRIRTPAQNTGRTPRLALATGRR